MTDFLKSLNICQSCA